MMNSILKSIACAGVAGAMTIGASAPSMAMGAVGARSLASASSPLLVQTAFHGGRFRGRGFGRRFGGYGRGGGLGAGLAGFAAGAVIGTALARPSYYAGPVVPASDPIAYCEARFRSYSPATGTYLGYDGLYHRCP